jgi:integrase
MNCLKEAAAMPHLSPPTLTHGEQKPILHATRRNLRDHLVHSLALGTGLRLAEIVGLNVGDVYTPDGTAPNQPTPSARRSKRPDHASESQVIARRRNYAPWDSFPTPVAADADLQPGFDLF